MKPPPRAASTNETTLLGTTTLDNSERTEPLAAAAVEDSVETKQLPHDTPTENGSIWHGPSVGELNSDWSIHPVRVDDWCELDNLLFLDKAILSGG